MCNEILVSVMNRFLQIFMVFAFQFCKTNFEHSYVATFLKFVTPVCPPLYWSLLGSRMKRKLSECRINRKDVMKKVMV